ncbi:MULTISPECIES: SMI1/KNR4 family protein [Bacillus]|nr:MULTISPECIES: SMI1/KNR4 family protein [Bacillus]MDR4959083.1 SMI1/KNR4 family protein [Bacillus sonorensis]UBF35153.1 SMI1/KNR4 family protein [Bacillus sp. PM8313]WOV63102.1 SMI1/KNR4 family protein [Bacillus sp. KICET-3]WPP39146.1 SMI1/KNR4 family protein [Bacillus sonorensis]
MSESTLKEFNGCSPVDKRVVIFEGFRESMNNLLSMETQRDQLDFNNFKDRLVDNLIHFKTDAGGNLFCVDYRDSARNPTVFFGDNEEAFENPEAAVTYVCDNFTEFINSLRV